MSPPIFALSTHPFRQALHLHRLSGHGVFSLLAPFLFLPGASQSCFSFPKLNKFPVTRYLKILDDKHHVIDDVVITFFPGPHSYTGENTMEICCHGNPLISAKLQKLFRQLGMVDAKPGEFTQRAVLNGKMDLLQAEGIQDLIHTETWGGVQLARNQLDGALSEQTSIVRGQLIAILAYLEAHIDFAPDEVGDYQPQSLLAQVQAAQDKLEEWLASYATAKKIRTGLSVVLTGKPNAGKSTLFNALLKQDRAIVTEVAGTTRDVLEERLLIENQDFVLQDTAGIRQTDDVVEKKGVEKSLEALHNADFVCLVVDCHQTKLAEVIQEESHQFQIEPGRQLIVLTKTDLLDDKSLSAIKKMSFHAPVAFVSPTNLKELHFQLLEFHQRFFSQQNQKQSALLTSQRQQDKIKIAIGYLKEASELIKLADFPEKIASCLYSAICALAEMLGEVGTEDVFEQVFSTFCIGK